MDADTRAAYMHHQKIARVGSERAAVAKARQISALMFSSGPVRALSTSVRPSADACPYPHCVVSLLSLDHRLTDRLTMAGRWAGTLSWPILEYHVLSYTGWKTGLSNSKAAFTPHGASVGHADGLLVCQVLGMRARTVCCASWWSTSLRIVALPKLQKMWKLQNESICVVLDRGYDHCTRSRGGGR